MKKITILFRLAACPGKLMAGNAKNGLDISLILLAFYRFRNRAHVYCIPNPYALRMKNHGRWLMCFLTSVHSTTLPWNIAAEIKQQNARLAELGTKFVTAVPKLGVG